MKRKHYVPSHDFEYLPSLRYAVLPEGQTLTEDKNCNEIKAELEAENAENPRLGRPTPRSDPFLMNSLKC